MRMRREHEVGDLRGIFLGQSPEANGSFGTPTLFTHDGRLPRQRSDEVNIAVILVGIPLRLIDCRGVHAVPLLKCSLRCLQTRQAESGCNLPTGLLLSGLKRVWVVTRQRLEGKISEHSDRL